jgi:hypothetical protein
MLAFSVKLSNEGLADLDPSHNKNAKTREPTNNSNKPIYKKFFNLAKEDLASEPRYCYF